ncbi:MAG: succinate dehydrogenase assembly factor 2 [Sphingomonadaceae bacterium]
MNTQDRLKRLKFRSSHRGTREADMMIGHFFDAHGADWGEAEIDWFEAFLEEQDVDIMAWALGTQPVPERWTGPQMAAFCKLDYLNPPA